MSRQLAAARFLTAGLALAALSGCPLPQPTPGVGQVPGRTYTPPRIVTGTVDPVDTIVGYEPDPAKCPTSLPGGTDGALFEISATVADEITANTVVARWFVDYAPQNPLYNRPVSQEVLPPPTDSTQVERKLTPYPFQPVFFDNPSPHVHVVEVVIATAFAAEPSPEPYRTPATGYETQLFRWIFNPVVTGGLCTNPP